MLAAANRMRSSEEFSDTIRHGQRSGNKILVIHVMTDAYTNEADRKVGFVVAKNVGNSVVRHRVYRRLRHVVRELLPALRVRSLVVRAQPAAAQASSAELRRALLRELRRTQAINEDLPTSTQPGTAVVPQLPTESTLGP